MGNSQSTETLVLDPKKRKFQFKMSALFNKTVEQDDELNEQNLQKIFGDKPYFIKCIFLNLFNISVL